MLPPRFPISNELALILGALLLLFFASPVADWWAVPAFDAMDWENPAAAPGTRTKSATLQKAAEAEKGTYTYWLGTDTMGRDVTSRLVYGARVSLTVGLLSPVIGFFLGGILGCLAGYFRGRLESVIVAAMDVILAFPGIVLLLAISFYLGPSLRNLVIAAIGFDEKRGDIVTVDSLAFQPDATPGALVDLGAFLGSLQRGLVVSRRHARPLDLEPSRFHRSH